MKLEILIGTPQPEECVALSTALLVLTQKHRAQHSGASIQPLSLWARAGRLENTALRSVPLQSSLWLCSERLAQPWQS